MTVQVVTLIGFVFSLLNLLLFFVLPTKQATNRTLNLVRDITLVVMTTGMLLNAYIGLPPLLGVFLAFGCMLSFLGLALYYFTVTSRQD